MRGTCESKACGDDETGAALVVADGSVPAGGLQRDSDLGSAGEMKGPFEEDFDEMPPKERPSQYDFLRDSIDGTVVVLPRGEVPGFGEKTSMAVLRAALSRFPGACS